ncbi:MAG TPA: hemerythrin domain-containing protein [Ignavibacteria bacterium]|nr:hemerythrin domain-containing protein [Ignavibacteria bacterium]
MQTQRPLVYEVPHKAIRNLLSQLSLEAGKADYNKKSDIDKLSAFLKDAVMILNTHAEHENNVPLKYLELKIPGSSAHDKEDHERIETEMYKIEEKFKEISSAAGDRNSEGNNFYEQISDFHSKYLQHMLEEERVTQPLLWKNFTDEELHQQEIEIRSSIPPGDMLVWMKYMMPASRDNVRLLMLSGIKQMAPPEFFNAIMGVTKSVLSSEEYSELEKGLEKI